LLLLNTNNNNNTNTNNNKKKNNNTNNTNNTKNKNNKTKNTNNSKNSSRKIKACIVILARNSELSRLKRTIQSFEKAFNANYQYPYLFLNNEAFPQIFKDEIQNLSQSKMEFSVIPEEMWGYPKWIEQTKAKEERTKMSTKKSTLWWIRNISIYV